MDDISTLIILGATGDLTSRLLLPGVGRLLTDQPGRRLKIVGADLPTKDQDEWSATVKSAFDSAGANGDAVEHALTHTRYLPTDATSPEQLRQLMEAAEGIPALYFALPPSVTARAINALHDVGLPEHTVLALEKPFGTDQQSAADLNRKLASLVTEEQIFRVDHFLGKSSVLNILGLRFTNVLFEPLWNRDHVAKVEIVYDEQLGLEGRAGYYDSSGALIDMIQSHLIQVMALVTMEAPTSLEAADLRAVKTEALRAVRPWGSDPATASRRARYTAGTIDGRQLPSYVEEEGVQARRETETLAEVTLESQSWRWAGVPFTLRSGKALGERRREIVLTFRDVPHVPEGMQGMISPAVLRLRLGPDSMSLEFNINGPGDPYVIDRAHLMTEFGEGRLNPYGEVLNGILQRDPSLSLRGEAAEQAWRVIDEIRGAWSNGRVPLEEYAAGSGGPEHWGK
ncbi:glucose-6-phosphate dehydrogenase [Arthrobacter sp. Soil782]|uniref:glucose-6-phosphate dehydrogenase n=1 Tax=Arthrobacter sp. Soil782 TaxID=1736410 RepID=UPI0006F6ABC0|nr:glucose-6-phosphate dehydrogenase [Arthrobacter sp. Soil782]KRF08966.1 glucose-6-phosphate dehydrogenase [Arthrobacter sp. Soil782]